MSLATPNLHTHIVKSGTCPHGMPQGACPICNGMAGGNSTTKRDTPRNVGEMTYNQCAAIGAMLKAQKNAKLQTQATHQARLESLAEFQKNILSTHQRLVEFRAFITNNLPKIIAKPIIFLIDTMIVNTLKFVRNLPLVFSNIIINISQKFTDISDKLAAIYGEIKSSIKEKISKISIKFNKKIKSLFFILGDEETAEEGEKIEEAKKIFKFKNFIHRLYKNIIKNKKAENYALESAK